MLLLFAPFFADSYYPVALTPIVSASKQTGTSGIPHGSNSKPSAPGASHIPSPARHTPAPKGPKQKSSNSSSSSSDTISFKSTTPRYDVPLKKGKGPVLKGTVNLKTIFFGDNFKSHFQQDYLTIINDALASLSGSKYFGEMGSFAGEVPKIKYDPNMDSGVFGPVDFQMK